MIELHTGGATGSDYAWMRVATHHKIICHVSSFLGHRTLCPFDRVDMGFVKLHTHNDNDLALAHPHLEKTNQTLQRRWPTGNQMVNNLLRRNYLIVKDAAQVIGIGRLNKHRTIVGGGTGWGIQMGLDLGIETWVFDQKDGFWYVWSTMEAVFVKTDSPPNITGKFAGIGTRAINQAGVAAIIDVVKKIFPRDM